MELEKNLQFNHEATPNYKFQVDIGHVNNAFNGQALNLILAGEYGNDSKSLQLQCLKFGAWILGIICTWNKCLEMTKNNDLPTQAQIGVKNLKGLKSVTALAHTICSHSPARDEKNT
jgi:hypothetical protein